MNILSTGGPGSGKGTQCEKLLSEAHDHSFIPVVPVAETLPSHIYHLNIGGLLREALQFYRNQVQTNVAESERSPYGPVLEAMMSTGQILPSWVTVTIIKQEVARIAEEVNSGVKSVRYVYSKSVYDKTVCV